MVPVTVILFGLLGAGVIRERWERVVIRVVLCFSVVMPSSCLWASVVQVLSALGNHLSEQIGAFVREVIHEADVAWISPQLWFDTKGVARQTLSVLWRYQVPSSRYWDAVDIKLLPRTWKSTGEILQMPEIQRFQRANKNKSVEYTVFRRIDRTYPLKNDIGH